jgi:hypothetical protein
VRAAACVVLAAALLLAGCGGGDGRREAVDDYIEQVDSAQASLLGKKGQLDLVLARFDLVDPKAGDVAALGRAEDDLRRTAAKVRAIEPPRDARRLHGDVVRLLELQANVTRELVLAARYVPRFRSALEPLGDATTRLGTDLKAAGQTRASIAAFAAYRTSLSAILRELEPLTPPEALRPSLVGQRRALARSVALCSEVEDALRRGDVSGVGEALRALASLSTGPQAVRTRNAEIAAAKAYNKRLTTIGKLARKVERERVALDTSLD